MIFTEGEELGTGAGLGLLGPQTNAAPAVPAPRLSASAESQLLLGRDIAAAIGDETQSFLEAANPREG